MTIPSPESTIMMPPTDVVAVWQERSALNPTVRWSEMINEEHASAFTVAKIANLDLLNAVRRSLDDVIRNGGTFEEWRANILPELQRAGWWGLVQNRELTGTDQAIMINDRRLRTIYRTNVRMSVAAGLWRKIQREKDIAPYLRYLSNHWRKRPRKDHQSWHGIILPVDHPAWQWMFPPNGWGCKCHVQQVTEGMMKRNGWKVSEAPSPPFEPFETAGGRTVMVPEGVAPGFGYNPGTAHLEVLADAVARTALDARQNGFSKQAADLELSFTRSVRDVRLSSMPPLTQIVSATDRAMSAKSDKAETVYSTLFLNLPGRTYTARRVLTADGIRHALNRHAAGGRAKDAYPIESADIWLIPTIQRLGVQTTTYAKGKPVAVVTTLRIGSLVYELVEEVGLRSGRAALKTLYLRTARAGE